MRNTSSHDATALSVLNKQVDAGAIDSAIYNQLVESGKIDGEQIKTILESEGDFPWQTQWQSVRDGEGIIAFNDEGRAAGYAFFRKLTDEQGNHARTILYQCETAPDEKEREEITNALLNSVFENFADPISRTAVNVPVTANAATYKVLRDRGFEKNISQVFMKKELQE